LAHLPGAPEQALDAGDQDGRMLAGVIGHDGPTAGAAAGTGAGIGGAGGLGALVGESHARTKWTTTATAKVMVDSIARLNSMRIPTPRALMASQAEGMALPQSCRRNACEAERPMRKPIGSPRKGITKMPTMPEARPTSTGHIGTSAACRRLPVSRRSEEHTSELQSR